MTRLFKLLRLCALLLAACLAAAPAHAAKEIAVTTCIAPLSGAAMASELMKRPGAFDCSSPQTDHGPGNFLARLRFAAVQPDINDQLVLRTTSVWQQGATVHFRYADGHREEIRYSSGDVSRFITIGSIFEFPVPWRASPLDAVFVETRQSGNLRGIVLGPRIMTAGEARTLQLGMMALYASFAGLALALVVYNLSLWAAMRHRFQLYYCGMVAALSGYTFSSSGSLLLLLPWFDNNDRLAVNYITLTLTAVMAMQFIRHFFGAETYSNRLDRVIRLTSVFAIACTLAFAAFAPWQLWLLDRMYFLSIFAMLCFSVPLTWGARKSRYFRLYLLAWSAPVVTSFLRSMHGFNLIEYSFWLDNGNLIAMAIEALLSSILVTARLRELSLERDDAVAGEQVARRLASTDPLTGLLNRRAFLELAIGRKGRQRLLLIDIDHFKQVNDKLGHASGDDVLAAVAAVLQQCRPANSLAVRLGGEEFALLIPRAQFADSHAQLVLDAVRSMPLPQAQGVTVSIGVAEGTLASEEDWKRLYRLADAALYRAKSDGRDRFCRATDFRVAA